MFIGALFAGRLPVRCYNRTAYPGRSRPELGALEAFVDKVLDEDRRSPRKEHQPRVASIVSLR